MKKLLLVLVLLVLAPRVWAWGEAGHYMLTEAAALSLPTDMPPFFYEAFSDLVWLSYDPDRWRGAGESLDDVNGPNHYIDLEFVSHLQLTPNRLQFLSLLETSGTLRRHGIRSREVGFLPWQIAELTEQLTSQWRQWRSLRGPERAHAERAIINTAGVLAHYVGDAANPHHTTMHHNGWVAANPMRYPVDCGTHARFETVFVSHAVERQEIMPAVAAPVLRAGDFAGALAYIRASHALVEPMYRLDRDGGFDFIGRPPAAGKQFAIERLAAGASMLRDLWWSSWRNSERTPRRE